MFLLLQIVTTIIYSILFNIVASREVCSTTYETSTVRQGYNSYTTQDYDYVVHCDHASLEMLDAFSIDSDGKQAKKIVFERSTIPTVPVGPFNPFTNLEEIYLNCSGVQNVDPGAFSGLSQLQKLHLHKNNISVIHRGAINGLLSLIYLDLSYNNISKLDEYIFTGLSKLETLYLSNNYIHFIDEGTFLTNKNLKYLDLTSNNISALNENTFARQSTLETLLLNNNNISVMSNIFFNPSSLGTWFNYFGVINKVEICIKVFDVSFNYIKTIPSFVFNATPYLTKLNMSNNAIEQITDDSLIGLHALQDLNLSNNKIAYIPTGIFRDLKTLQRLDLSNNILKIIQFGLFTSLSKLTALDLTGNQISQLEVLILYPLRSLSLLKIAQNFISEFDVLKMVTHLKSIEQISLDGNNLTCDWLTNNIHLLKEHNITVLYVPSYKTDNVNGISCKHDYGTRLRADIRNFSTLSDMTSISISTSDEDTKNALCKHSAEFRGLLISSFVILIVLFIITSVIVYKRYVTNFCQIKRSEEPNNIRSHCLELYNKRLFVNVP